MFLKQIVLDGFKSYRDRTDIGPFDPHFNAITGLNGSGKSNILDAICFVLGLSSMSVVRAANLAELIYKGGGHGVTRASASLIFDNKDKSQGRCPVGYEKFDEIIVSRTIEASGTCKFYLNSVTSTKKTITDLFESVQLNIGTPNFMIMQGKITKVINMTPKQILAMIEETVGGNVYQGKRDKTEQEIKNKDRTIETVKSTIHDEIYPEWKRQRDAREKLQEFQTLEYQTQRAVKNFAIVKYKSLSEQLEQNREKLDKVISEEKHDDGKILQYKEEIEANKTRQQQMKKENTEKFKDRIAQAEQALKAEKTNFVTIEAKQVASQKDLQEAQKKLAEAEDSRKREEKKMEDYKKKSSDTVGEFEEVKGQIAKAEDDLARAKEQQNALQMGNIVDEEGNTCDARKELMRVQDELNKIQPDFQVAHQSYDEDIRKLEKMEHELKKTPTNEQVEKDYNAKFQRAEKLKVEARKRNINPDDIPSEILKQLNNNKSEHQKLMREKESICNRNPNFSIRYERQNVDASKIHGCVCELVQFKDIEEWGGALEVLSGGILGHIIVEDSATAKALLNSGLSRRTFVHPLDVFKSNNNSRVTQQELDRKLGPGKAVPAIDLIQCDPRYRTIVQNYFGGRVLCDDISTARKIAFDLHYYAVSKLGDVVDPDGMMQGGKRNNLGDLVKTADRLRHISEQLNGLGGTIRDLQARLNSAQANDDFMKQLEVAKRDLHNAEETRKLTTYSILRREIDELKGKLKTEEESLKEQKLQVNKLDKEKKSWESKVSQLEKLRDKNKKDNAALITKCEKELDAAKKRYEKKQKHFENIDIEIQSKEALINDCQKDVDVANNEIAQCNTALQKIESAFAEAKKRFDSVKANHDAAVAESMEWNAEYNQIEEEIHKLNKAIHQFEVKKIKRGNTIEKLEASVNHSEREIDIMRKENRTLNFEKEELPEDEKNKSWQTLKAEADKLKKRFDEVRERIDVQAAEQFGQTKKLLSSAEDKLNTIEENKKSLMTTIGRLDEQKETIVREAYSKVNEEFNKMMGTLLPDSAARLVLVNPDDLSQGLNIHVRLGEVWKESLSELSGGQKSLVALALVLSLCMYNPAPFYILDEIDSALDLNHTQNIGVLIKRKFVGTQFVCVSLKDGMYSNCNILFQVQFNNGRSEVKRCVRQSSKKTDDGDTTRSSKNEKRFNKIVTGK